MQKLAVVENRIASLGQLLGVVSAMRSLAAVRIQQATEAMKAASHYADIVDLSVQQALTLTPKPAGTRGKPAIVLFGSEHGFVGACNDLLVATAHTLPTAEVLLLGSRAKAAADEAGLSLAWHSPMTSQAAGLVTLAARLAEEVRRRRPSRVDAVFGHSQAGGAWRPEVRRIIPIETRNDAAAPHAPFHYLAADTLRETLIDEALFAQLTCCAALALSSENVARFRAMTTARDNIERKMATLRAEERALRQDQITNELLDVVCGAEVALTRSPAR